MPVSIATVAAPRNQLRVRVHVTSICVAWRRGMTILTVVHVRYLSAHIAVEKMWPRRVFLVLRKFLFSTGKQRKWRHASLPICRCSINLSTTVLSTTSKGETERGEQLAVSITGRQSNTAAGLIFHTFYHYM